MTIKSLLPITAVVSLACSPIAIAKPLKALIIDGQNNHQVWPQSTVMMRDRLEDSGLFKVDVERTQYTWGGQELLSRYRIDSKKVTTAVDEPQTDPDFKPDFSAYDVVISNFGWKTADWPIETQRAFEAYVANGGGFVSVHAADNAFATWPEYNLMIGLGGWGGRDESSGPMVYLNDQGHQVIDTQKGRAGSHGEKQEFLITLREPHPITNGMPSSWLHAKDEIYGKLRGPAQNMTIIATAYSDPTTKGTGRHEPVMMTLNYKKGRVFHTTLGHDEKAFDDVGFITTLIRGAEWAATGRATYPIPKDFPTEQHTSARTFHSTEWVQLLDKDLSKWDVFVGVPHTSIVGLPFGTPQADQPGEGIPLGLNNDIKKVVSMIEQDGQPILKLTGEMYVGVTTRQSFGNYHFSAEVKWGDKKWPPRENAKRDSGLLYHCTGPHGAFWNVWKRTVEFQIQEGDFGDLFMLAGTGGTVRVKDLVQEQKWDPKHGWDITKPYQRSGRVKHEGDFESPHGEWNLVEVYTLDQKAIHMVNGQVVLAIDDIRYKGDEPLTEGEIQLQSEGAEVYYRNIKIRNIEQFPEDLTVKAGF